MSRLRQNNREQAVGMVQTGMTHQAVADHLDVSKITISRLMIHLLQTGRTNDRPRSGSPLLTLQPQGRYLRLIHIRNSIITVEDTARRTSGLANVRISSRLFAEDYLSGTPS